MAYIYKCFVKILSAAISCCRENSYETGVDGQFVEMNKQKDTLIAIYLPIL